MDILLRQGYAAFLIPVKLPQQVFTFGCYALFALLALFITFLFSRMDKTSLPELGIVTDKKNRIDFFYGFLIGVFLWTLVSLFQSLWAGFDWQLVTEIDFTALLYILVFIFIADLGTELFTRGYPLAGLKTNQW